MTLQLLWLEYRERHPDGYQYSQFCEPYRKWRAKLDVVMRQQHRAGEKMLVDWAGHSIPLVDAKTGATRQARPAQDLRSLTGIRSCKSRMDVDPKKAVYTVKL